ncbi:MAG TPA: RNA polymerase subunit sigma-24, partial [Afipia sp.]|nr:RNA polymerase subunit sigma-24 [Afipia sp.]
RRGLKEPPPWAAVLSLRSASGTARRPDRAAEPSGRPAEIVSAAAALCEVESLASQSLENFLPYHAVRADLFARTGRTDAALVAYRKALALEPSVAEARWLERKAPALKRI